MKKYILLINTVLLISLLLQLPGLAYTPVSEKVNTYIQEEGQVYIREIYEFPPTLLPENITVLFIIPCAPDSKELLLVGKSEEGNYYDFGKVPFTGELNMAKTDIYYNTEDGLVYIYSQMPSVAFCYTAKYNWDTEKQRLILIDEWTEDPSAEALEEVEKLLAEGEIEKAAEELSYILYPQNYYDPCEMAVKFLRSAHKRAVEEYRAGSNDSWTLIMKSLNDLPLSGKWIFEFPSKNDYEKSDYAKYMEYKDFIIIVNDYGFLMEQAGKAKDALYVLNYVLSLSPERTVAHLNLADALYKTGDKEEAKKYYTSYI